MPSSKRDQRPRQTASLRARKSQAEAQIAALVREIRALLRTMDPQEPQRPPKRRR